ncbi:MAG: DUF3332 family protein [Bdellovibrionota bacterium]
MKNVPSLRSVAMILALAVTNSTLVGCAAGDFGFTRGVAHWNLRFSLLPRILVYILLIIIPVYPIAMFLDVILNNTIQFWTGSAVFVAQNKTFYKDGLRVEVAHSANPLRKTVITAYDKDGKVASTVELRETAQKAIELYVDNMKRAEVKDIRDGIRLLEETSGHVTKARTFALDEFAGLDLESPARVRENLAAIQQIIHSAPLDAAPALAMRSAR